MAMGDIETVYDGETQKLIDFYNNQINEIAENYKKKIDGVIKTATGISHLESYGGIERLREEIEISIKPFREALRNIYLTAVPTYIIKKDSDNNASS